MMVMVLVMMTMVLVMMVMTMMVMVMMMVANLKSDHPSIRLVQCRKDIMGVGTNIGWKYLYYKEANDDRDSAWIWVDSLYNFVFFPNI